MLSDLDVELDLGSYLALSKLSTLPVGTTKSNEPVSKSAVNFWGGVPISISPVQTV